MDNAKFLTLALDLQASKGTNLLDMDDLIAVARVCGLAVSSRPASNRGSVMSILRSLENEQGVTVHREKDSRKQTGYRLECPVKEPVEPPVSSFSDYLSGPIVNVLPHDVELFEFLTQSTHQWEDVPERLTPLPPGWEIASPFRVQRNSEDKGVLEQIVQLLQWGYSPEAIKGIMDHEGKALMGSAVTLEKIQGLKKGLGLG